MQHQDTIRDLLRRVRTRWRNLTIFRAGTRAAFGGAVVLAVGLLVALTLARRPPALAATGAVTLAAGLAFAARALAPLGRVPSEARVARFIEERAPDLDDRLVTAVDVVSSGRAPVSAAVADLMVADAARRASALDLETIVASSDVRRAAVGFASGLLLVAALLVAGRGVIHESWDAAAMVLFPPRVQPGAVPGTAVNGGRAPKVTRIDVDYMYPPGLGLKPRTEEDSGDIYAPAGTDVRVHVHTDRPPARATMTFGSGTKLPLETEGPNVVSAPLKVVADGSYRIALADRDGLERTGEVEYFIRMLQDRPPEVHLTKPATDRSVTRLEEVDIEAQADDDYGIASMDLVYSVRGGAEKRLPFAVPGHATSVSGRRTLYLEDLDLQPGDFVSYYARARDLARGKGSSEARSDIFFLDVKPFEQEFSLAVSQSMAGGGSNGSIDDLVNEQKQVVVATWKLDRRARTAAGRSDQDIRTVGRTEAELKSRVERTASGFRESTMRDPGRRRPGRGASPDAPGAGETMPEEDAMAAASAAMARAVTSLDALKTGDALAPELEALNMLLKAQATVKKRQVSRQQAGAGGPGNSNRNYDISTLFDRELQRSQQSNYETPKTNEQGPERQNDALERVKELARRQDELNKRQEQLSRDRAAMGQDQMQRELERLTREQSELRQRLEDLAQQTANRQQSGSPSQSRESKSPPKDAQSGGQSGAGSSGGESGRQMRDASEQMRNAASELRRQEPGRASASGSRALQTLRDLERRLQANGPADARRRLGDLQLEARQLADGERQLDQALGRTPQNADPDKLRRLAGDQQRLAERARRLEENVKQQARGPSPGQEAGARAAAAGAARDLEREKLSTRMQASADRLNAAAGQGGANGSKRVGSDQPSSPQELARALDQVADKLGPSGASQDARSRQIAEQLARTEQARKRLDEIGRDLQTAAQQGAARGGAQPGARKTEGETGRSGKGQAGGDRGGSDLAQLREEYARRLRETQDLLNQMRRDTPQTEQSGAGFTFEGQGMVLSAPGTEAFKQDFAKWEELRRQAAYALDTAAASLSKRLRAENAKDRLASGTDDKAPAAYQRLVEQYFKAIAGRKR